MTAVPAGRRPRLLRPAVWLLHMLLPLLGLWLLLARPFLDVRWSTTPATSGWWSPWRWSTWCSACR